MPDPVYAISKEQADRDPCARAHEFAFSTMRILQSRKNGLATKRRITPVNRVCWCSCNFISSVRCEASKPKKAVPKEPGATAGIVSIEGSDGPGLVPLPRLPSSARCEK